MFGPPTYNTCSPNNDNNTTFYIDVVKRFGYKPSRAKVKKKYLGYF